MTLLLEKGTEPKSLPVKTHFFDDFVSMGEYEISMYDFCCAAYYVLTNTDLYPDDPRLKFVKRVKDLRRINGFDPTQKRLGRKTKK